MNAKLPIYLRILSASSLAAFFLLSALTLAAVTLTAQQPPPSTAAAQREAMRKLAFLVGRWSGPVTIVRGPGEPLHRTQTEDVQFKLDGLVLLIEGASRGSEGAAQFAALATVSFDDSTQTYRFRAYNNGHYIDTELKLLDNGFSWGFDAGPAHISNTMRLTAKGEWSEVTEAAMGASPPHRSVEMLLARQP